MTTLHKAAVSATTILLLSSGLSCYYGGGPLYSYASLAAVNVTSSVDADLDAPDVPSSDTATVRKLTTIRDVAPQLDSTEVATFQRITRRARAESVYRMPLDSIVQWVGERFIGAQYVGGLLDEAKEEELVVSFQKFDCVLFVETVLALSDGIRLQDYTGAGFTNRLRKLRYRDGEMNGYVSRLHYFSDWIYDNQSLGFVRDITEEIGGEARTKELNIMSKHRRLYKRLADNDSLLQEIELMEQRLNDVPQYYVPQNNMKSALELIRPGDIVSTATIARGLDVSHSGFAYRNADGTIGLLHASSANGEVTITRSLENYVLGNRLVEGIVVARPVH